jgi:hypothetical protein
MIIQTYIIKLLIRQGLRVVTHLVFNTPQTKEDKIMLGNMSSPSIRDQKKK